MILCHLHSGRFHLWVSTCLVSPTWAREGFAGPPNPREFHSGPSIQGDFTLDHQSGTISLWISNPWKVHSERNSFRYSKFDQCRRVSLFDTVDQSSGIALFQISWSIQTNFTDSTQSSCIALFSISWSIQPSFNFRYSAPFTIRIEWIKSSWSRTCQMVGLEINWNP